MKQSDLDGFTGTESWTRVSSLFPYMLLTDGAKYLADHSKCYWLFDIIASHQVKKLRKEEFQVWTIRKSVDGCVVSCNDGNNNLLARQAVEFTDFPFQVQKLYAVWENDNLVVLLPSEY